jgi:hypothetical protein
MDPHPAWEWAKRLFCRPSLIVLDLLAKDLNLSDAKCSLFENV